MACEKKEEQMKLVYTRPADFMLHFTNSIQIAPGRPGEVQLFFGQIVAPPSGAAFETVEVRQDIGIVLTSGEAKNFVALMQKQIQLFESEVWTTTTSDEDLRRIMITCPETQKPLSTGKVTDRQSF